MPGIPYPCGLLLIIILLYHVDGLLHIAENKVAVAIICLGSHHNQWASQAIA